MRQKLYIRTSQNSNVNEARLGDEHHNQSKNVMKGCLYNTKTNGVV